MTFSAQDKQDYKTYLERSLLLEHKKPESIAKKVNINNLSEDLNSLK